MAERCCLCSADVSNGSCKIKRRRVFGEASKSTLEVFDSLALQHFNQTLSVTVDKDAFFCHKCRCLADSFVSLVDKVRHTEKNLIEMIGVGIGSAGRKRCRPDEDQLNEDDQIHLVKSPCTAQNDNEDYQEELETNVSVKIKWPSKERNFVINTPWRKESIKQLTRKNLRSFSSSILSSSASLNSLLKKIIQLIQKEMKDICSDQSDSVIRDMYDGVIFFSWDRLFSELTKKMPILMKLLGGFVNDSNEKKRTPLVCCIASMLLKKRYSKMALFQRAMSVFLYGNGCTKEVYKCLQPLMISLSHSGTMKLLDRLSQDHDIKVQYWSHDLTDHMKNLSRVEHVQSSTLATQTVYTDDDDDEDDEAFCYTQWQFEDENLMDDTVIDDDVVDEEVNDGETCVLGEETNHKDSSINDKSLTDSIISGISDNCDVTVSDTIESEDFSYDNDIDGCNNNVWSGFKLVGDNLDKNFRRSYQRVDCQTISHHYFHTYAVKDRVDLSHFSDLPKNDVIDITQLLPTEQDNVQIKKEFSILISRVIVKHMPQFYDSLVSWHIPHKYSAEMKLKSEIVPLGLEFKNENKTDEMCQIMDSLHKYVPSLPIKTQVVLPDGGTFELCDNALFQIPFGGDMLTVARARGAIAIRDDHDLSTDKLLGLSPVIEDWHCRMTLLKVIWKRLFSVKSATDKGTLYQLKNLIHRTSVPNDPQQNVKATEDFLEVVLVAHIITAAEKEYVDGMELDDLCQLIVDKYVSVFSNKATSNKSKNDLIHVYACELLSLALVWWNYYDSIREGDGERVMRLWKYLLVIFKLNGNKNYAKEAALLLTNFQFIVSERMSMQMMMSRFINTKGRIGCNIPCDLHLEHLNRRLKGIISRMESNVKLSSLNRAANSIGIVDKICQRFRDEMMTEESDNHKKPSYNKDLNLILDILREVKVFNNISKRKHQFLTLKGCLFESADTDKLKEWIFGTIA